MRKTIGFLTANIHTGAAQPLWRGVLDAATAGDANLIGFPGGRLNVTENFEAQRNTLYKLIDPHHLDGLVSWTSALAGAATPDEVAQFHRDYRPLPIVSLASPIDDYPMVSIDGYQGMRDLIGYTTYYLWFLAGNHRTQAVVEDADLTWVSQNVANLRKFGL